MNPGASALFFYSHFTVNNISHFGGEVYLRTPVAVPDEPGKIVFTRKKDSAYVYLETGRTYDPASTATAAALHP